MRNHSDGGVTIWRSAAATTPLGAMDKLVGPTAGNATKIDMDVNQDTTVTAKFDVEPAAK